MICRFNCFVTQHPANTQISTLSLHDALPIYTISAAAVFYFDDLRGNTDGDLFRCLTFDIQPDGCMDRIKQCIVHSRSEDHTSELQSQFHLVCRLQREKNNFALRDAGYAAATA